jgi:hypothetical protein
MRCRDMYERKGEFPSLRRASCGIFDSLNRLSILDYSTRIDQKYSLYPALAPHQPFFHFSYKLLLNAEILLEFCENEGYYTFDPALEAVLIS